MDEVQRWMTSISKCEYIVSFEEQGWDCMEAVKMMNENDVRRCVSKEGHVKIILSEIKKLLQANQPTFQKTINPASKSTDITMGKRWKNLNVYHPYPKQQKTKFSNSILPAMYEAAYPSLQSRFEGYFVKECDKRYKRNNMVEKWKKKYEFWVGDNPAGFGQIITGNPALKPERIDFCTSGIADVEKRISDIENEIKTIQDSYSDISNPSTGEIHKFASEQLKYNETQVGILLTLANDHKQLKDKLEAYVESVQSTFVLLPKNPKASKAYLSRRGKENMRKKVKRKMKRQERSLRLFLEDAVALNLKHLYFGSSDFELNQLNDLAEPLSTNEVDMSKFNELHYKQRDIIYNYVNGKGWFSIDVIVHMQESLSKDTCGSE